MKIVQNECQLEPDRPIVVGVSGGADSICLFDLLFRAGYPLQVVYFNHHLRPQAIEEAQYVEDLARSRGALFALGSGDVYGYANQQGISLESAARRLRYRFLFECANAIQAQAVAVAHHADDQVETVLLHLLRGSGMAGLRGMLLVQLPNPWSQKVPLIRPLLHFWRSEILSYCREQQLVPLEDHTNLDLTFTRNRIRHELIPFLERYNPRIKEALWRMSQIVQGEVQAVEQWADSVWETCRMQQAEGALALDAQAVCALPIAVQRQILRRALRSLRGGLEDVDFDLVERAIQAFQRPPATRQLDLGLGLRLAWEEGLVWLATWEADLPWGDFPQLLDLQAQGVQVEAPGILDLGDGWRLELEEAPVDLAWQWMERYPDPFQAWVDAEQAPLPWYVRPRRPGDRFQPLGMGGRSQKLSDFMINVRMPRRARGRWPLVCAGEQVLWVPGYALSHLARLRQTTRRVIHISLSRTLQGINP